MGLHSRQTKASHLWADKIATALFSFSGLGVIFAVVGMLLFFLATVFPLFQPLALELLREEKLDTEVVTFRRDVHSPFVSQVERVGSGGCVLRSLLWPSGGGADERAVLESFHLSWPAGAEPQLSREPSAAAVTPVQCWGGSRSVALIRSVAEPHRLALAEIAISRRFLSQDEVKRLPEQVVTHLNERGWSEHDGGLYAQASAVAPISQLGTSLNWKFVWDQGGSSAESALEENAEAAQLSPRDPAFWSEFDHVVLQQGTEERALLQFHSTRDLMGVMLFEVSENMLTGESQVTHETFPLTPGVLSVDLVAAGQAVVETVTGSGSGLSSPQSAVSAGFRFTPWEEAWEGQQESRFFLSHELGEPLSHSLLAFGANTLFLLGESGACAAYDVSYAFLNVRDRPLTPRWRSRCFSGSQETLAQVVTSTSQRLSLLIFHDGLVRAYDLTTGEEVLEDVPFPQLNSESAAAVPEKARRAHLYFDYSGYHLIAVFSGSLSELELHADDLEGSLARMFRSIHYEGYEDESFSWQSTASSDDFETKYSLWPLLWGTLKATLYAMVFAVPLGIFAAVYSSEILDRTTRNFVKPTIEMMASLPSVVLGFLAAIVLAPWIEANILGVLLCGLVLPFSLYFLGNVVSRYSAKHVSGRGLYASRRLLALILVGLIVGFFVFLNLGSQIELLAFAGDLKMYLSGGPGSTAILYGILLLPLCLIGLWSIPLGRFQKAWKTLVFVFGPFVSIGFGFLLHQLSGDSQLAFAGYSQRNALVICIAMGFAIIPIIYSLAEDALTAVPGQLRAGSLACGASVWQTTAKVVLPTAASGIFSAVMVGFGRAIGETMIVVMATGNSALISINPFEGLRTLSANIAVELPEAPKDGTHYRILFFSGLVLFLLTFALNTAAEVMRSRYRKRNKAL